jgi:hypothetical protein
VLVAAGLNSTHVGTEWLGRNYLILSMWICAVTWERTLKHSHARPAPPMFGELDTVVGRLLPRSRFGMRAEPGAHQALLGVHRICWCGSGSVAAQLSEL